MVNLTLVFDDASVVNVTLNWSIVDDGVFEELWSNDSRCSTAGATTTCVVNHTATRTDNATGDVDINGISDKGWYIQLAAVKKFWPRTRFFIKLFI